MFLLVDLTLTCLWKMDLVVISDLLPFKALMGCRLPTYKIYCTGLAALKPLPLYTLLSAC
jgi:hypothetical protein